MTWRQHDIAHFLTKYGSQTIEQMEQLLIFATLDFCRGNKSMTARHLGIDRRTLYRKIAKYESIGAKMSAETPRDRFQSPPIPEM